MASVDCHISCDFALTIEQYLAIYCSDRLNDSTEICDFDVLYMRLQLTEYNILRRRMVVLFYHSADRALKSEINTPRYCFRIWYSFAAGILFFDKKWPDTPLFLRKERCEIGIHAPESQRFRAVQ